MIPWVKMYHNIYGFEYEYFFFKIFKYNFGFTIYFCEKKNKWRIGGSAFRREEIYCDSREEAEEILREKITALRDLLTDFLDDKKKVEPIDIKTLWRLWRKK